MGFPEYPVKIDFISHLQRHLKYRKGLLSSGHMIVNISDMLFIGNFPIMESFGYQLIKNLTVNAS
jgi:hypothetical protein